MYPALLSSEPRLPGVRRRPMKRQVKVRIMLPMSIRCNTCGNHICRGTKFSSRKEEAVGVTYLGIQRFRFYFECSKCYAELTIKAYPRDPDCMVESEATRVVENGKRKRDAEEMGDVMKSTSSDSKREIDILPALDDMDSMKKSKDFIHRVKDEDSEDVEDLIRPCARNDESLNSALKRKFSEEFSDKPTDSLTKATISDFSNDRVINKNGGLSSKNED
ncbi:hypothetical protein ACJRO7_016865 [Eucalyptus globulus]|uniref:Splicing factor YJU2 n=1 Tax=Eucalyptus globulus TaxID=34317 RepID=A0ABD3KZK5_EUCGL